MFATGSVRHDAATTPPPPASTLPSASTQQELQLQQQMILNMSQLSTSSANFQQHPPPESRLSGPGGFTQAKPALYQHQLATQGGGDSVGTPSSPGTGYDYQDLDEKRRSESQLAQGLLLQRQYANFSIADGQYLPSNGSSPAPASDGYLESVKDRHIRRLNQELVWLKDRLHEAEGWKNRAILAENQRDAALQQVTSLQQKVTTLNSVLDDARSQLQGRDSEMDRQKAEVVTLKETVQRLSRENTMLKDNSPCNSRQPGSLGGTCSQELEKLHKFVDTLKSTVLDQQVKLLSLRAPHSHPGQRAPLPTMSSSAHSAPCIASTSCITAQAAGGDKSGDFLTATTMLTTPSTSSRVQAGAGVRGQLSACQEVNVPARPVDLPQRKIAVTEGAGGGLPPSSSTQHHFLPGQTVADSVGSPRSPVHHGKSRSQVIIPNKPEVGLRPLSRSEVVGSIGSSSSGVSSMGSSAPAVTSSQSRKAALGMMRVAPPPPHVLAQPQFVYEAEVAEPPRGDNLHQLLYMPPLSTAAGLTLNPQPRLPAATALNPLSTTPASALNPRLPGMSGAALNQLSTAPVFNPPPPPLQPASSDLSGYQTASAGSGITTTTEGDCLRMVNQRMMGGGNMILQHDRSPARTEATLAAQANAFCGNNKDEAAQQLGQDSVADPAGSRVHSDRTCPVCGQDFSQVPMEDFQSHVFDCFDEAGPDTMKAPDDEEEQPHHGLSANGGGRDVVAPPLRTCPICSVVFEPHVPQPEFERHVHNHFGEENFEILQP